MTAQQRVAFLLPNLAGGGAERIMLNLAAGVAEQGHRVDLVLFQEEGPYLPLVPPAIRLVNLDAKSMFHAAPILARYLKREQPDALLSALNQPNVAAVWARRIAQVDVRISISIHNTLSVESRNGKSLRLKMMPWFVKRYSSWADEIIAVSGGVADDLAELTRLPRSRVRVIYNPVVTDEMLSKSLEPAEHPWLAPGQPPVLLSVGRLNPQKDYPLLLRAFAAVRSKQVCRLVILGEGEERSALEALAQELGVATDVSLPGFASNPFACMNKARLFVLSSRWEGLPTVLIEALACGCPVVSTDCPSGPGEILSGGKWGRLTPVGDMEALASAIEQSLNEPRQTPPHQSWEPYRRELVLKEYLKVLLRPESAREETALIL